MDITISLLNERHDELGRMRLETVRVIGAGIETEPPDLSGQMAGLADRLTLALMQERMAPALDLIDLRIAVSRALLAPAAGEVLIPLPVRPVAAQPGTVTQADHVKADHVKADHADAGWDDLFVLDGPDMAGDPESSAGDRATGEASQDPPFWRMDDQEDDA